MFLKRREISGYFRKIKCAGGDSSEVKITHKWDSERSDRESERSDKKKDGSQEIKMRKDMEGQDRREIRMP